MVVTLRALVVALCVATPLAAADMRGSSEPVTNHGKRDGIASYYGRKSAKALTAAHRTLPFGTEVRVTNTRNGTSCVVRINDRGPFIKGRIIDVSYAAARALGMVGSGLAPVRLTIEKPPPGWVLPASEILFRRESRAPRAAARAR